MMTMTSCSPEWQRPDLERRSGNIVRDQKWNDVAWPGFDENGDFINDHNQNRNYLTMRAFLTFSFRSS